MWKRTMCDETRGHTGWMLNPLLSVLCILGNRETSFLPISRSNCGQSKHRIKSRVSITMAAIAELPLESARTSLPIFPARNAIIHDIRKNDCCIVVGETGSGKTTQIPQVTIFVLTRASPLWITLSPSPAVSFGVWFCQARCNSMHAATTSCRHHYSQEGLRGEGLPARNRGSNSRGLGAAVQAVRA